MTAQIQQPERTERADEPTPRLFTASECRAMREAGIFGERERLELIDGKLFCAYADKPRLFSVEDFHVMAEAGVFHEEERVELMNGVIIAMPVPGIDHCYAVDELAERLIIELSGLARVRVQGTLLLERAEVMPDIVVLRRRRDLYRNARPSAEDALLVIEVSDSTLRYDLNAKLAMYAESGARETWIANIPARRVEVYTDPIGGTYLTRRVFEVGQSVSPLAFPDVSIPVELIVPA